MNRKERTHAEKLVRRLVDGDELELVEDADIGALVDAVGAQLVEWKDDGHRGPALAHLLTAHPQVAEVFAGDDVLQAEVVRWRQAVRGSVGVVTDARNAEIEARLAAEEDDELAAVYADWLIEHGNPLGELFACAGDDKARKRVLVKYGAVLWGRLAEYAKLFECTWGRAGVRAVTVKRATAFELEWGRAIGAFLDLPLAMFCRSLAIGTLPPAASSQLDNLLDVIALRPRPRLRAVAMTAESRYRPIELEHFADGFPGLETFTLAASHVKAPIAHPRLVELNLRLDGLPALEHALARAELPALRRLAIATQYTPEGPKLLGSLVTAPWFGALEQLDVKGMCSATAVLREYGERLRHLHVV